MKKALSIRTAVGLSLMLGTVLAMPAWAKAGPGGGGTSAGCSGTTGKTYQVTSIFKDTDNSGNPFLLQDDGLGPYKSYKNSKTDQVSSVMNGGNCDWILALINSKQRTVRLSLVHEDNGSFFPAGWPTDGTPVNVAAELYGQCELNPANNNVGVGAMTPGQTFQCAMHATFYSPFDGTLYSLRMNPDNYAGATWMQVACTGGSGSQCTKWEISPIPNLVLQPNGQSSVIGELVQPSCYGCQSGTAEGLFYSSFSITITNP